MKNKRAGLGLSVLMAALIGAVNKPEPPQYDGGWTKISVEQEEANDRYLLADLPNDWEGTGAGKTRLLYQDYEKVHGHAYVPRAQGRAPSCVGQSAAAACDILAAVEIRSGESERAPPAGASAEVIYGLSRHQIGEISSNFGGGSHCLWAAQALQKYGVVPLRNYPLIGYDLREPSAKMAVKLGYEGAPLGLQLIAKQHPVLEYVKVESWSDLRDAIYNGSPVMVGSRQGFGSKNNARRDSDGFLKPPSGWLRKSVWRHAMVIIAMSDEGREGALILNSWGANWVKGPKRFGDEPDGSFWVDKSVIHRMMVYGDSYAVMNFKGYPAYNLWKR